MAVVMHHILSATRVAVEPGKALPILVVSYGPYTVVGRRFRAAELRDKRRLDGSSGPVVIENPGPMEVFA